MYEGAEYFEDTVDPTLLPDHLAKRLRGARAREIAVEGNRIFFKAGVFRMVSNWNPLVAFGFGELTVDSVTHQVHYRLSLRQLVVMGSIALGLMTMIILASRNWQSILFMPLMWAWVVGGNFAFGVLSFQRFIRRAVESAPPKAVAMKKN